MVGFLNGCLLFAARGTLLEEVPQLRMAPPVATCRVATWRQPSQEQVPHNGMKHGSLLAYGTHEREMTIGLPAFLEIYVIQGGQEHVQDGHIEKAWDRAKDQVLAVRFRQLSQEQLQQVIADLFRFVLRSDLRRDLLPFKVGRGQHAPPCIGL